jgi:hypothetical protein
MHAARPEAGTTYTRPLTVSAWNGVEVTEAQGSFVQSSSDRRPMARAALTVLGGAAMIFGAFRLWTSQPSSTGTGWNFSRLIVHFDERQDLVIRDKPIRQFLFDEGFLRPVDTIVSAGSITILLAVLALFGLTGTTGRLTRAAAVLCAVFVVVFLAALTLGGAVNFATGAALVLVGCVIAFAGGLLARH